MQNKKNILLITDVNYWKREIGSHQRLYSFIEYLKIYFNLIIAYTKEKEKEDEYYISNLNHKVTFVSELDESEYDLQEIESLIDNNEVLKEFYNKTIVSKMQTLIQKIDFSHVLVEYIKLSYLLPMFQDKITILDTHDIMNKRNESFKKNNQKHWIDISEKEELNILSMYNRVICIQQIEHNYLLENNIKSLCCPHPIESKNLLKKFNLNDKKQIIFIAGYSIANNNSIKWFIENVWIYFKNIEEVQLSVYGDVSRYLEKYEDKFDNLVLHGKISDLEVAYKNSVIAINPVQMGGGLKIKNIEALAYGIPLITTSEGSKGLENEIDNSFLVANSKDEWIEKLLSLIISNDLRNNLSKKSVNFISKHFNAKKCFNDLVNYINENQV